MLLKAKIGNDPFVFLVLWLPFRKIWTNQMDRNTDFLRNISRIDWAFLQGKYFDLHFLHVYVVPEKLFSGYYKVRRNNFRLNTFFISRSKRNTGKTMFYKQAFHTMIMILMIFSYHDLFIKPFIANPLFLYPLKISENRQLK